MSAPREGGCACGAVRYRLTSDPLFTHCCHCLNCQRQTGSAFVINLLIEAYRVELLAGAPQPVDVPRDDGSKQLIFRCPTCQVAVFSQYGRPEVRFVRGGTLDQPSGVTPDVLLADEPTGNLDSTTGGEIIDVLRELNVSSEQTIVLITHDADVAAETSRTVRMQDGSIVEPGIARVAEAVQQ